MTVQLPVRVKSPSDKLKVASSGSSRQSIIDAIPLPLVLLLASPYLAGKSSQDAITRAHQIYQNDHFSSTIDILGEDCRNDEDCEHFVKVYKQVIDLIAKNPLPCKRSQQQISVSFKPSMFSVATPSDSVKSCDRLLSAAYERILTIVDYAKQRGIAMTIEAEDHNWTDFHLDTYFSLLNAGYTNLGTVLQSRLFRTKQDLKRFDERCRVRMVIGIYNEPANLALTEKQQMKKYIVDYAAELAGKGTYLEIASHDTDCLNSFFHKVAIPQHLSYNRFEIQMLLGVPRKELQIELVKGDYCKSLVQNVSAEHKTYLNDLACNGVVMRLYLPFGNDSVAGPYCKRRLKANPNMISYGIKNLFHIH